MALFKQNFPNLDLTENIADIIELLIENEQDRDVETPFFTRPDLLFGDDYVSDHENYSTIFNCEPEVFTLDIQNFIAKFADIFLEKGYLLEEGSGMVCATDVNGGRHIMIQKDRLMPSFFSQYIRTLFDDIDIVGFIKVMNYTMSREFDRKTEIFRWQEFIRINSRTVPDIVAYAMMLPYSFKEILPETFAKIFCLCGYTEDEFVQTELPNLREMEEEWKHQAKMQQLLKIKVKKEKRKERKSKKNAFLRKKRGDFRFLNYFDPIWIHRELEMAPGLKNRFRVLLDLSQEKKRQLLFDLTYNVENEMTKYLNGLSVSEVLQIFCVINIDKLGQKCEGTCSNAIGDICNVWRENYLINYKRRCNADVTSLDDMWETTLNNHYNCNRHHPEYKSLWGDEKMRPKDTMECLIDLLSSAMRIAPNAVEAFKMVTEWLFDWVPTAGIYSQTLNTARVKPKFAPLHSGATFIFIAWVCKRGLSLSSTKKMNFNDVRKQPCTPEELRVPILQIWNDANSPNNRFKCMRFMNLLNDKHPKFKAYIRELEWHRTTVELMGYEFRLPKGHDADKFHYQSIVAYVWKWFISPTLPNHNKPQMERFDKERYRTLPDIPRRLIKKMIKQEPGQDGDCAERIRHMTVDIDQLIGTADDGLFTKVKNGLMTSIEKTSNAMLKPIAEPLAKMCDSVTQLLGKMEGMLETLVEKFKDLIQRFTGLSLVKNAMSYFKIVSLIVDFLIFVNTDNTLLKIAVILHALSTLGILEKIYDCLKAIFSGELDEDEISSEAGSSEAPKENIEKEPEFDPDTETSDDPIWFKFVECVSEINPKNAAIFSTIVIGLILGRSAMKNARNFDFGSKVTDGMRSMHFVGAGILGAERILAYTLSGIKAAIDWIREKYFGKTSEEKQKKETDAAEAEMVVRYLSSLDFWATQEGSATMRKSQQAKEQVKKLLSEGYALMARARAEQFPKELNVRIIQSSRKLTEVHDCLHRYTSATAFRHTPFHIQFVGKPGVGKSRLMKAISYELWRHYHKDKMPFNQCIYQPNAAKQHWDRYHGQLILWLDDMWQHLAPEKVVEIVSIINSVPLCVPMSNLRDKDEMLVARDVVSSSNIEQPRCNDLADLVAIQRRRDLLVECVTEPEVTDSVNSKFCLKLYMKRYMKFDKKIWLPKHLDQFLNQITPKVLLEMEKEAENESWFEEKSKVIKVADKTPEQICEMLKEYHSTTVKKDQYFPHLRFNLLKPVRGEDGERYFGKNEELPSGIVQPTMGMTYKQLLGVMHSRRQKKEAEEIDIYEKHDNATLAYDFYTEIDELKKSLKLKDADYKDRCLWANNHFNLDELEEMIIDDNDEFDFNVPNIHDVNYQKATAEAQPKPNTNDEWFEKGDEIFIMPYNGTLFRINLTKKMTKMGTVTRAMNKADLDLLLDTGMLNKDRYDSEQEVVKTDDEELHCCYFDAYNGGLDPKYCEVCGQVRCDACDYTDLEVRRKCKHTHTCEFVNGNRCRNKSEGRTCITCKQPVCLEHSTVCEQHARLAYNTNVYPARVKNQYITSWEENERALDVLRGKLREGETLESRFSKLGKKKLDLKAMFEGLVAGAEPEEEDEPEATIGESLGFYDDDIEQRLKAGMILQFRLFPNMKRERLVKYNRVTDITAKMSDFAQQHNLDDLKLYEWVPYANFDGVVLTTKETESPLFKPLMTAMNRDNFIKSNWKKMTCTHSGLKPCDHCGNRGAHLPINKFFLERIVKQNGEWIYNYDKEDLGYSRYAFAMECGGDPPKRASPAMTYMHNCCQWWFNSYDFFFHELNEEQREYLVATTPARFTALSKMWRLGQLVKKLFIARYFTIPIYFFKNIKAMWEHPQLRTVKSGFVLLLMAVIMINTIRSICNLFFGSSKVEPTSKVMFKQKKVSPLINTSECLQNLSDSCQNNLVALEFQGMRANGIGIDGHVILLNKHFLKGWKEHEEMILKIQYTWRSEDYFPYVIERKNIYDLPNTDVLAVYSPLFSPFKKIIHKFRMEKDYAKHMLKDLTLLYRKNGLVHHKFFKPQDLIAKFMRRSLDGQEYQVGTNVLSYKGDPEKGSSGGFLITDDNYAPRNILGIQCFRDANGSYGYANLIYQEQLHKILEYFKERNIVHEGPYEVEFTSTQCEKLINTQITVEGKVPEEHIVGQVYKSIFVKTPIADEFKSDRIPAIINPFDNRVPVDVHPMQHSLNKIGRDVMQPLDQSTLDFCTEQYSTFLASELDYPKLDYLEFEEVIQGIDEDGCEKVNNRTSPGIPWVHLRNLPGKKSFLQYDEQGEISFMDPRVKEEFEFFEEEMKNGCVPPHSMYEFPKDELRPIKKALGPPIKTRSITVLNFVVNLLWRKYGLHLESLEHQNARGEVPHCVGINPESLDWTRLYQSLKRVSDVGSDLDIGNWDGHMTMQLALACAKVYSNLYQDENTEADRIRKCILDVVFHGWFQFGDMVCQKHRGMSSGFAGTAEINTKGHILLFYYIITSLIKQKLKILITWKVFKTHCSFFVYGDDIVFSISEALQAHVSPKEIADQYEFYGWPATSASKITTEITLAPIEDLQFLKRTFRPSELFGTSLIFGALDKNVIEDLRFWMRKTANLNEQFYVNLRLACVYAFFHGEEYFSRFLKETNLALQKNSLPPLYERFSSIAWLCYARFFSDDRDSAAASLSI